MNKPIRHGEIMLVPTDSMPETKAKKYDAYIVGHSETGHHHVLEANMEIAESDQDLYFRLFEPGKLVHKKATDRHKDLVIPAGIYKRYHDTEYSPWDKVIRQVAD